MWFASTVTTELLHAGCTGAAVIVTLLLADKERAHAWFSNGAALQLEHGFVGWS